MREEQVWEKLREVCVVPKLIYMVRITEKLGEGVPDTTWCLPDVDKAGWLELKVTETIVPKRTKIPWKSPAQPLWLYMWANRGGRAGCLLRNKKDGVWYFWKAEGSVEWNTMIQTPDAFLPENITASREGFSPDWLRACLLV